MTHEPWLVALSVLVAIQGAYVGLSLAVQIGGAVGARRRVLLAGAAVSLAVAIWAMHFVGMLAARLPFPVDYLVFPTLLSFLVCVLVVGAAVFAVSAGPLTVGRLAASAVFMGLGIVVDALHRHDGAPCQRPHDPRARCSWSASVVIAIAASGLALRLAAARDGRAPLLLSATALGIAISGMHYTAMAGLTIFPHDNPPRRRRPFARSPGDRRCHRRLHRLGPLPARSSCPTVRPARLPATAPSQAPRVLGEPPADSGMLRCRRPTPARRPTTAGNP